MLRRPSTFVSNRGEALGAPPPGGKTDETEVGGPPATAAPARGGRVGGAGAGKLVPRARDGRLGAVHRQAGRTVASPPERRPRAVPGRRVHPRQLLVRSAPGAAAWPWPAGSGTRPHWAARRGQGGAGRCPQVGLRRCVPAAASGAHGAGTLRGAGRAPRAPGRLRAGAPAAPGAQCPRLTPGSVWKGSTRLRLEQGGWDAHLRARHGQGQGHGHGQGHGGALAPELWAKAP